MKVVLAILLIALVANVSADMCLPSNIDQCPQMIQAAAQYCNSTLATQNNFDFAKFATCVATYPGVMKIQGCSYCYCNEAEIQCPANVSKPGNNSKPDSMCRLPEVSGCPDAVAQGVQLCNKQFENMSAPEGPFNYAKFARCVANSQAVLAIQGCKACYCQQNLLSDCSAPQMESSTASSMDICFPGNIDQCPQMLQAAGEYCNNTFATMKNFDFAKYAYCVATYPNVMKIQGCSYCYCQETEIQCPSNVTKPVPQNKTTNQCHLPEVTGCPDAVKQASTLCNQSLSNVTPVAGPFNYQGFAHCVMNSSYVQNIQGCAQCFCEENLLGNCANAQHYQQPKCSIQKQPLCYMSVSAAVKKCNATVSSNSTGQYYQSFYNCIGNQPAVKAQAGCAQCYCQESLSNFVNCNVASE